MKHKITCQHCKSRYLNCHSECSNYIAYRKERDEILEIKAKKIKEICDVKAFNVKETSGSEVNFFAEAGRKLRICLITM